MSQSANTDAVQAAVHDVLGLAQTGRLDEALALANNLIRLHRRDIRAWLLLSEVNRLRGNLAGAIECARTAVKLAPNESHCYVQLGRCLALSGLRDEAIRVAREAVDHKPQHAGLLDGIGSIYSLAGDHAKALSFFRRAVEAQPEVADLHFNLATCERMNGNLDAAERCCAKVISLNPRYYQTYYILSDLRKWTTEDNHIAQMEQLLSDGIHNRQDEVYVRFALAKEYEDIKEYEKSFVHRLAGCGLKRENMRYDVRDDLDTIDRIISTHTSSRLGGLARGCPDDSPIFVMGLPRTGTTLVERIISSHTQVCSAGELNNFAVSLVKLAQRQFGAGMPTKQQLVEQSLDLDTDALGRSYIDSARPYTGGTPRFIDKLPLNYLYCGLIHAALPNARLILLQRDPMDTCYAIFKALFTSGYPFSYDLDELGKYYLAYNRLAGHWCDVLREKLLVVQYEELVNDQEKQSRRMIEYCGLQWEDRCLEFTASEIPSSTASAVQVRQPIYESSVGLWRNYEKQLTSLKGLLTLNGIEIK